MPYFSTALPPLRPVQEPPRRQQELRRVVPLHQVPRVADRDRLAVRDLLPIRCIVSSEKTSLRSPRVTSVGQSICRQHSHSCSGDHGPSCLPRSRITRSYFQVHLPSAPSRMLYFSAPSTCSRVLPVYSCMRSANSSSVSRLSGSFWNRWMRCRPRVIVSGPVSTMVSDLSVPGCRDAHTKLLRPP